MKRNVARLAVLALLLAATIEATDSEYRTTLDLLRILADKPWIGQRPPNQWDRPPQDPGTADASPEDDGHNYDDMSSVSSKRSAVATALNSGRRRRQPTPALGKAITPYAGVGVLNNMGSFFDSLRDNLETLASLSPQQRSSLFQDPPTVVHAPVTGTGSGGTGMRRLHALRPLRPTGNIRSYNRRSFVETGGIYPGANHHDPALLWTGLGR